MGRDIFKVWMEIGWDGIGAWAWLGVGGCNDKLIDYSRYTRSLVYGKRQLQ